MNFPVGTEFPDGIFIIYQTGSQNTVVTELKWTKDGGSDDANIYHLRAKLLSTDGIDSCGMVVIFDSETITKIEQITEDRFTYLQEITTRRMQTQDIESAVKLQNAVQVGQQAGLVHGVEDDKHGPEANEVPPSHAQTPEGSVANDCDNSVAEAPFAPKTVASQPHVAPPTPSRDEEVEEHVGTLIDVPPPGS